MIYIIALAFLFVSFFYYGKEMVLILHPLNLDSFYFGFSNIFAFIFSFFVDIFSGYPTLYKAKDNNMLLSLPIKRESILLSRIFIIYFCALLFSSVIILPVTLSYVIYARNVLFLKKIQVFVFQILILIFLSLLETSLLIFVGFFISYFRSKVKRKTLATTLVCVLSFIVIGGGVIFISIGMINTISRKTLTSNNTGILSPYSILDVLLLALISLGVFVLSFLILKSTYFKIVSDEEKVLNRKKHKIRNEKKVSVLSSLIKKERKAFFSNSIYLMNMGIGAVMMIILSICLFVFRGNILSIIKELNIESESISFLVVGIMLSFSAIPGPSISLERDTLDLNRSFPLKVSDIFKGKIFMAVEFVSIPLLLLDISLIITFKIEIAKACLIVIFSIISLFLVQSFSLIMGLWKPNLTWTNPVVVLKQSLSVVLSLFLPSLYFSLFYVIAVFLKISMMVILLSEFLITTLLLFFSILWLKKRGEKIYRDL